MATANLYAADAGTSYIYRVNSTGTQTIIAGNGSTGYMPANEGGSTTGVSVNLMAPCALAVSSDGTTVYVAEGSVSMIRTFTVGGAINKVIGAFPIAAGYSTDCTTSNCALAANVSAPAGLALDSSGNLYFFRYGQQPYSQDRRQRHSYYGGGQL